MHSVRAENLFKEVGFPNGLDQILGLHRSPAIETHVVDVLVDFLKSPDPLDLLL